MYAIVVITGKQYKVTKGDVIEVDRMEGDVGSTHTFSDVLLTDDGTTVKVGTPHVKGAKVQATITSQLQGEKINVRRYKQKVRHRRSIGFRPQITKLTIDSVSA